MPNIVAIVGRPNVGKSTLFNRLVKRRDAIVDSVSGVTRDRHYGKSDWNGKEFSVIDGCFVIRGDGVIDSAGSLLHASSEHYENLPSGFGTRHAAAAAITRACDCISICISASNGQVTLFRKGVMFPLLEKPINP